MSTEATKKNKVDVARRKRIEKAALHKALAEKKCRNCATVGAWEVTNLEPKGQRIRYIRCLGCGYRDQVSVVVDEHDEAADGPSEDGLSEAEKQD